MSTMDGRHISSPMRHGYTTGDGCVYNQLHLSSVVIHFEYNISQSANVPETTRMFNQRF